MSEVVVDEQRISRRRQIRLRLGLVLGLFVALMTFDANRPPAAQWSARLLLWGIDTYQATLSPLMPSMGVHCRFDPTCSHYAEASIRRHGAFLGVGRTLWRLARCGPWTESGTVDLP